MSRFDRARDYITQLEKAGYEGTLRVQTEGVTTFLSENQLPLAQKGLFNKKSSTPLHSIQWGFPGSMPRWRGTGPRKTWKDVIIAALYKLDIKDIQTLENVKYEELLNTKGVKMLAPIIRDSMKRAGYSLL